MNDVATKPTTDLRQEAGTILQNAQAARVQHQAAMACLRDEIRVLEEVLPLKRVALERMENTQGEYVEMVREAMEFFRETCRGH